MTTPTLRIVTRHMLKSGECDMCKQETIRAQQMFLGNRAMSLPIYVCLLCCGDTYSA